MANSDFQISQKTFNRCYLALALFAITFLRVIDAIVIVS